MNSAFLRADFQRKARGMEIDYPALFPTEQRVRVDSFFVGSRTVHEWGTVVSLDGSQLTVQVDFAESGDATFSSANRHISVRTGLKNQAYLCRAEVLAFSEELLILNLTGEIVTDELREYFRLDTSLPSGAVASSSRPTPPGGSARRSRGRSPISPGRSGCRSTWSRP